MTKYKIIDAFQLITAERFNPRTWRDSEFLRRAVTEDSIGFYCITAHMQRVDLAAGDYLIPEPGMDLAFAYPVKAKIFESKYVEAEGT